MFYVNIDNAKKENGTKADEKKMRFLAERTGWNLATEENGSVLSISSGRFCRHDGKFAEETFVYSLSPESSESMRKEVTLAYENFFPSDYAYFLQDEYPEKHRDTATPPVLSIAKFAEYVDKQLFALSETLVANLNPGSFLEEIIKIAERNGFEVFVESKGFSERFSFWDFDRHLDACIEYE